jgi:hypothetical protein
VRFCPRLASLVYSASGEPSSALVVSRSSLRGQSRGGRFPSLDRLDLLDHGRLLIGEDAGSVVARPELTELLVAGAEFTLGQLSGAGGCRNASGKGPGSAPGAT